MRVVITGMGAVSALGHSADEFWSAIRSGKSGVGPITSFDTTDYTTKIAAEVKNLDPSAYLN
ncbi:MAG: beta-ketoacyl synthase N-terminal-like domain-containing protein, partial [Salinispira sp.]